MIERAELLDAATKAFGGQLAPDAATSWQWLSDMGWLMMAVPEAQGGLGLGREAEAVIHMAMGRALVPGPVIAQMMVIAALAQADDFAGRGDLLARAIAGEVMTCSLSPPPVIAGGVIHSAVPDADIASHILTIGDEAILLHPAGYGCTRRPTWDETRRLFDVTIADTGGAIILATGQAATALAERLHSQHLFALAADALGGADAVLQMTLDYLKTRRQFDRPLAMFQALKHRVADMKAMLVAADALFWARVAGAPSLVEIGALKAHCCRVYNDIAEEAVQLHGGIGLTAEHRCHLFLKRAMLNCALGGDADYWEERAGRAAMGT